MKLKDRLLELWLRLRYGQYSFGYVDYYRSRKLRTPMPPCIKSDPAVLLLPFYQKARNSAFFQTESHILFEDVPFHTPSRQVLAGRGIPACFSAFMVSGQELKVFGFPAEVFGLKGRIAFFFMKDVFVMGEYQIPMRDDQVMSRVTKAIAEKYDLGLMGVNDNYYVEDESGMIIYAEKKRDKFYVRYFCQDNSDKYNMLEAYLKEQQR